MHDDPLESLGRFHRRIERQLATLAELPVRLDGGLDAAAIGSAAATLEFFDIRLPVHHAQEEHELIPLLLRRITLSEERDRFREIRMRLESDHRELRDVWRRLRAPLEAIAEGVPRKLPGDLIQYFRAVHAIHISTEESALHAMATRWLSPGDLDALAQRLQGQPAARHATVMPVT